MTLDPLTPETPPTSPKPEPTLTDTSKEILTISQEIANALFAFKGVKGVAIIVDAGKGSSVTVETADKAFSSIMSLIRHISAAQTKILACTLDAMDEAKQEETKTNESLHLGC